MIPAPVPADLCAEPSTTLSAALQTELTLAAIPTAPSCARGHVRAVAHEWGLAELADTAELLACELVTNAVQASERLRSRAEPANVPVVRLWLLSDRLSMVIGAWDASDDMPVRQEAMPDAECGRGLMLVEALSKGWGAYRKSDGKVVWAMVSPPDDL